MGIERDGGLSGRVLVGEGTLTHALFVWAQKIELHSAEYFAACGLGGILSCGLTHTAVTPLDLVKCNAQANPEYFKNTVQGFRAIYSGGVTTLGFGSGATGLLKGWGPTLWGYSLQGLFKFGLYEYFKHSFSQLVGPEAAYKYRDLVYISASASAEFFADIALCPFEAIKVRIQTNPKFARGLLDGLPKFIKAEGFGNLYAGVGPLWARQIPYTIIKAPPSLTPCVLSSRATSSDSDSALLERRERCDAPMALTIWSSRNSSWPLRGSPRPSTRCCPRRRRT